MDHRTLGLATQYTPMQVSEHGTMAPSVSSWNLPHLKRSLPLPLLPGEGYNLLALGRARLLLKTWTNVIQTFEQCP